MNPEEILKVIAEHFLCVRRLPFEVVSCWTYREGDENKTWVDSNGKLIESKREVVIEDYDLEYFQRTKPPKWEKRSPLERYEKYRKLFPNGMKLLKETRTVKNGRWWYVKQVKDTSSTVRFSREYDEFFAPTLQEAVQLYLASIVQ